MERLMERLMERQGYISIPKKRPEPFHHQFYTQVEELDVVEVEVAGNTSSRIHFYQMRDWQKRPSSPDMSIRNDGDYIHGGATRYFPNKPSLLRIYDVKAKTFHQRNVKRIWRKKD